MHLSFDDRLYWTNGIEIASKSVELNGNKTGLTHRANQHKIPSQNDDENGKETPRKDTSVAQWMMEVRNSSLAMLSFRLDAGMAGTTICLIFGSSIEVMDSEILSNMECSGFLLSDPMGMGASRIVIVRSSHKSSTRNMVLPLVGRGYRQLTTNHEQWKGSEDGCVESEEIIGVGLSFDSTHFVLGTGPLFSFDRKSLLSGSEIGRIGEVSTELRMSSLWNVTSSFEDRAGQSLGVGSCVWERVVGSRISGSTNHDMGTALCGTRLGGNIACLNTSFSSCVRTSNSEIDIKHENITETHIGRTVLKYPSATTSVKFTLCTFNEMTHNGAGSNDGGAAIFLNNTQSTLTVTQCIFHRCTCTADNDDGGAICVWESRTDRPTTISSCSFTECATDGTLGSYGGSVHCYSYSAVSISDCFFENIRSSDADGGISLWDNPFSSLFNCAFYYCFSKKCGGALGFHYSESIDLSFIQFRECSSENEHWSRDILFVGMDASVLNSNTVQFCDSFSSAPNIWDESNSVDLSDLVPQLNSIPTVTIEVSINEGTATITAIAS
ncbi:hypothetical protein BLNAU_8716 [Blattamonas nauphoetae]|uniref:Uncharacterized protein n=1 Tax=Blattamonas nauphoetae TaxID=2049346 RepID=A0ABQ9XY00_9EUKA|nr:hypothetical protein BLNAU_8716 [Blattamonas nauphoetae]